ncbi:MAG: (d)CMP kinase [Polyangiaceae bacterium]
MSGAAPKRRRPIVAIDGPAGAGKSTVARKLANVLGFVLVDTGALYRAVAVAAQREGVAWDSADRVGALSQKLVEAHAISLGRDADGAILLRLSGQDISQAIRAPDIGMGASTVSAHPAVRGALLDMQRQAGREGGVVMEGRDIGTVVFPDAELKFFLTARAEVRAQRRYDELRAKGATVTLDETLEEVVRRDEQDSTRPVAPLKQAFDAQLVDDSDLTIDETVTKMAERVRAWQPV